MNLKKTCGITGYLDSTGKPLNLFKPDASISRAELITMVIKCRYGELTSVSEKPFSDVPVEHWAAPYIAKAKELKTVEGFEDGTFGTDLNASHAEALKMILLANFSQTEIENAQADNACNDIQSDAWYRQIFYFGLNKNIIGGFKDLNGNLTGECAPDLKVSRAEASKMMIEASEK